MAGRRISAVVTTDDLDKFFTGSGWKDPEVRGDLRTYNYKDYVFVDLKEGDVLYRYEVHAAEDPSDFKEGVTDAPTRELSDFIFGGIPGGESLGLACSPEALAYVLRAVAAGVEDGSVGPGRLAKTLRRCSLLPWFRAHRASVEEKGIKTLKEEMEEKGWKVRESESDAGKPKLDVDVSGIYEATIEVDSVEWDYTFVFEGPERLVEEGSSPDPIKEFRAWVRSDEYKDAVREREERVESLKDAPPESYAETLPAEGGYKGKDDPSRDEDVTVPPPRRVPA